MKPILNSNRLDPGLKIIVIPGHYNDDRLNEILADGRNCEFLKKPYTLKELDRKVEKLMSLR